MPSFKIPLPDTTDSVIRPIVISVTHDLCKSLGLIPDQQRIIFYDESNTYRQFGSSIGKEDSNEKEVRFHANDEIIIEVEKNIVEQDTTNQGVRRMMYPAIFRDDRVSTVLRPVYRTFELVFNFRKRFTSRAESVRWRNNMMYRRFEYTDLVHHTFKYNYIIPIPCIKILQKIHELRENVAPYGDEFAKYLQDNFTVRVVTVSNQAGNGRSLAIQETQSRVFGEFDWNVMPEKGDMSDKSDSWEISFTYTLQFQYPTHIVMDYPLVVHNQYLEYPYVPSEEEFQDPSIIPAGHRNYDWHTYILEHFMPYIDLYDRELKNGVKIPYYDDWELPSNSKLPGTIRFFQLRLVLDPENHEQTDIPLFQIHGIEEVSWDSDIVKFMVGESLYMTHPTDSVFQMQAFNQYGMLDFDAIRVDPTLMVIFNQPVNIRHMYHVLFSMYEDWTYLKHDSIKRLSRNPLVTYKLLAHISVNPNSIKGINWEKKIDEWIKSQGKLGNLTRDEMSVIIQHTAKGRMNGNLVREDQAYLGSFKPSSRDRTVQISSVITYHRKAGFRNDS